MYVSVFLYGPTRSGKTLCASTFPRPIFIFPYGEGSDKVIAGRDVPKVHIGAPVADGGSGSAMRDMKAALEHLLALDQMPSTAHPGKSQLYDWGETVCTESLSHYAEKVILELTDNGAKEMEGKLWSKFNQHFMWLRDALFRLRAHRVLTALDTVKTKGDKIISGGVQINGQTAQLILASCDIVGHTEQRSMGVQGSVWTTHVNTIGVFPGGTRLQGMPNMSFDNFNFPEHIAPYLQQ